MDGKLGDRVLETEGWEHAPEQELIQEAKGRGLRLGGWMMRTGGRKRRMM